jgi:hypothetical protein
MHDFIKHFRRESTGAWVCIEAVTLQGPEGQVQVAPGSRFPLGTTFMNLELASLLEAEHQRRKGNS